ncbi:hypothetical protein RN001_005231 [Aquatica leii]|uniref:Uncharacterized protein n=1 Tax=Aquatica leii TaxID=1421715 RepID=A0AAN7SHT0_9COLE|nr:hypothetical protein RN001_005231 [Aquatica leii]
MIRIETKTCLKIFLYKKELFQNIRNVNRNRSHASNVCISRYKSYSHMPQSCIAAINVVIKQPGCFHQLKKKLTK